MQHETANIANNLQDAAGGHAIRKGPRLVIDALAEMYDHSQPEQADEERIRGD